MQHSSERTTRPAAGRGPSAAPPTRCSTRSRRWPATTWPPTRRCWTRWPGRAPAGPPASCTSSASSPAPSGTQERARLANEHPPVLRTHDRYGNRIDEVEFHPAWHELMTVAVGHGLHAAPWADARPGAHVARAAKFYVWTQAEAGHGCPISMTYAAVAGAAARARRWPREFEPLLASRSYDSGLRPPDGQARACSPAWR